MKWGERRHCPHSNLRGIYGDEINHTPGYRRLQCRDCGRLLDGPVMLAIVRAGEEELRAHHPTESWVTAPDGEEFRAGECQGHAACPVKTHEHGCFADTGNCDHPEEHEPTD